MLVVYIGVKMDKTKLNDKDIGFTDEILELCKNLVSIESHAFGSYVSNKDEKWLKISKKAREMRTKWLSLITKKNNQQGWCISKHICECLMRLQECYTRFLSTNQQEEAKVCSEDYFELYSLFMILNDIGKDGIETSSSA